MAKIKLPEKPHGMVIFSIIQLRRTYREKIELEVFYISVKTDVSR